MLPAGSFSLARFGGRVSGTCIPKSDVDIVCELPADVIQRLDPRFGENLLRNFFLAVRARRVANGCTANPRIERNLTVSSTHSGQHVDFTWHAGDIATGHAPIVLSLVMKQALDEQPSVCRSLLMLVVDTAKRYDFCSNGNAGVRNTLEAVHVALLGLAFWRTSDNDASRPECCLLHMFLGWVRGAAPQEYAAGVRGGR